MKIKVRVYKNQRLGEMVTKEVVLGVEKWG